MNKSNGGGNRLRGVHGLGAYACFAELTKAYDWISENQIKFPGTVLEVRNPRGPSSKFSWLVVDAVEEKVRLRELEEHMAHCDQLRSDADARRTRPFGRLDHVAGRRALYRGTEMTAGTRAVVETIRDLAAGEPVPDGGGAMDWDNKNFVADPDWEND